MSTPIKTLIIRSFISLTVLCAIALSELGYIRNPLLEKLENVLYDIRLTTTMINTKSDNIVIIDIDEKSLVNHGQWPWRRDVIANLVNILFDHYEIKSLGFDMVFAEPQDNSALAVIDQISRISPNLELTELRTQYQFDNQFAESLFVRNVILGYVFKQSNSQNRDQRVGMLPQAIASTDVLGEAALHINHATSFTGNTAALQSAADFGGFFDYFRNQSTLRQVPLLQAFEGKLYPSLALQLAAVSIDANYHFNLNEHGNLLESIQINDHIIPISPNASMYVPFRGPMGSFNYLSATDIMSQKLEKSRLKDKIAIVGTSAAGLLDLRSTPVGKSYAGVEVHANTVSGILEQRVKAKPDYTLAIELLLMLTFALLMTFIFPVLTPKLGFLFLLCVTCMALVINLYCWQTLNLILNLAPLLILIALTAFFHINYNFFIEQKNKRALSKVFSQYIPSQVVEEFDLDEAKMSLTGDSREMTVFFADVRNFTSISESMSPTQLTQLMNAFLTPITREIHNTKGTIDKYMGDAVMAFWGAPIKDQNHANHAVASAKSIFDKLPELNEQLKRNNWPLIRIGIGLASGEMNVGNMGSEFRVAYSVLGDTVNLGSRLEGLTKVYGVPILVNENTKILANEHKFMRIDRVRVKGKQQPITLYTPILFDETYCQQFENALELYWQKEFSLAKQHFDKMNQASLHTLTSLFSKRCEQFLAQPPATNWDGVFQHSTK
ncbi:CHASE2 domain-containing protein [Pseudoalteromonas piratica]|uniref:CHASE2 domain-containing protein n=1 Tax=Pseudoalteromonas piratica TaxID=1348114 RepID=UPI00068BA275|nr:adenylate/guanylate cyclase domain-containing protein [Pseudoalteromonas piratica]